MDDDPAASVRKKKDSSLVRAAELVRDGNASAMVSAGNTGATMAFGATANGTASGVVRPCIATPIPNPGAPADRTRRRRANAECTAEMLVQVRPDGRVVVSARYGVGGAAVGLLLDRRRVVQGHAVGQGTHELLTGMRDQFCGQRRRPRPYSFARRRGW